MDLAAMKAKLASLSNKGKASEAFFKPTEGETIIRIVPLAGSPDNPFQELYFHYFTGKTMLSPRSYGETDPIADFSDALVREGGLSKEEWKEAKKFSPQLRTYVPIVVRGKESEGVKFWAFGKTIYEQLLSVIADEDYGDISDVTKGHDIKITFTPKEKSSTGFADTQLMVRPKPSALTADAALLKKLLEEQPNLMDCFNKWTADELTTALNNFLNPEAAKPATGPAPTPVASAGEDEWATGTPTPAPSAAPAKPSADVADEFDKIFNS